MKIKGLALGYVFLLTGLLCAAAVFCRYMSGRNLLPEGLSLSGGAVGLGTLLYSFFVANCSYLVRQNVSEAGNVAFVTRCVSHTGKKRGRQSQLAVCDYGIVVDLGSDGCKVINYEDVDECEVLPFEIRLHSRHRGKYRFVFDKKLRSKAIGDYLERYLDFVA